MWSLKNPPKHALKCTLFNQDTQILKSGSHDSTLTILVLKEFWEIKELRDELFDIVGVVHESLPCCRDGVELAVSTIKPESGQSGTEKKRNVWALNNLNKSKRK